MNPNKKLTMHYQGMIMLVSFQNISLPVAVVPPFSQGKENFTTVNTCVRVANAALAVDDGTFLQFFISRGDIPLRALIDVKASVQTGKWKSPSFGAHWDCDFDISRRLHETRCSCPRAVREPGIEFQTLLVQTVTNWTEFADLFRVTSTKISFKLWQMLLTCLQHFDRY